MSLFEQHNVQVTFSEVWRHCVAISSTPRSSTNLESESTHTCQYGTVLDDVSLYRTKIFIRFPKTLFDTEDLLQKRKHEIGTHPDLVYCHRWL